MSNRDTDGWKTSERQALALVLARGPVQSNWNAAYEFLLMLLDVEKLVLLTMTA
jgi:hypothetical protein